MDDEYVKLTPEDREQRQQMIEACQRLSYAIEALSRSVIRKKEAGNQTTQLEDKYARRDSG